MFFVLLKFSDNKAQARQHMDAHNRWLQDGFDDGIFLVAGSLQPNAGGAIVAHGCARDDLQRRLDTDPFVAAGVVKAEILEVTPAKASAELAFLLA
jgi:uncharacterized protein YciI